MLISEAIKRVMHLYHKGIDSDDSRLSKRYVYSKIRTARARIISQELRKKQVLSAWTYQTLSCFPMIIVPSHECLCVPYEGCEILRSECKLPEIFTDNNDHIIKSVTKITGTGIRFLDIEFSKTTWMQVKYQEGAKFIKSKSVYYVHDGYLYVVNNKMLKLLSLTAIFSDPIEAALACDFCNDLPDPCKSYLDYEFHIDDKLQDSVIQLASEDLIYVYARMNEDVSNDSSDSSGGTVPNPRSYRDVNRNTDPNLGVR